MGLNSNEWEEDTKFRESEEHLQKHSTGNDNMSWVLSYSLIMGPSLHSPHTILLSSA